MASDRAHQVAVARTFIDVVEPIWEAPAARPRSRSDSAFVVRASMPEEEEEDTPAEDTRASLPVATPKRGQAQECSSDSEDAETDPGNFDAEFACYKHVDEAVDAPRCSPYYANQASGSGEAYSFQTPPSPDGAWMVQAFVPMGHMMFPVVMMQPPTTTTSYALDTMPLRDGSASPAAASSSKTETEPKVCPAERTTVMLRNLPNDYTRGMVLELLDREGFEGLYDFLYLPVDFRSHSCLGYAFVNLVSPMATQQFWEKFNRYSSWTLPSRKVCQVTWSTPHQGLDEHIERYRNSPVMHESTPDEWKPMLLKDGRQVPFPAPTKPIRAPRLRGAPKPFERPRGEGDGSSAGAPTPAPWPTDSKAVDDVTRLLAENERLQMENQMLRKHRDVNAPVQREPARAVHSQETEHAKVVFTQDGLCWLVHADAPSPVRSGRPAPPQHRGANASPSPREPEQEQEESASGLEAGDRTTVMLRNLPNNYTRNNVIDMLDSKGFANLYDFVYLPIDLRSEACLGYAFVNLVNPSIVPDFWRKFEGFSDWVMPSRKVCYVSWSRPHQGLEDHVERYRNSPIMHESVPDEFKPVVFKDGSRVPFPAATRASRAPRLRQLTRKVTGTAGASC